jgi:uncharacterized protein YaaQ
MKLLIAVVQTDDAAVLTDALVRREIGVTRIDTSGGFLRRGNSTIVIGVDADRVDEVLGLFHSNCRTRLEFVTPTMAGAEIGELSAITPIEVQVGGATIWITDVDEFVRL